MSETEIEEYQKEKEGQVTKGFARWGWFGMMERLAERYGFTFEYIEKMNFILFLSLHGYLKEKAKFEDEVRKEQRRKI